VLREREQAVLLTRLEGPEDLWVPYLSWDGDPSSIEAAMAEVWDVELVAELERAFGELDPLTLPSARLRAFIYRWITGAAPRELDVLPEFVAFAFESAHGDAWENLWLSTTPEHWSRVRAAGLVPAAF